MQFIKKTFEYLFKLEKGKRFLCLFLMALPVGFSIALTAPQHVYKTWMENFEVGNLTFISAFTFGGNANPWFTLIFGAVTFILLLFSISVMASVISRNLRVGVFSVNRLFQEFNEAFFPSFSAVLTATVLVVIAKIILSTLIVLFQTFSNVVLSALLSMFALLVIIILVCYIISLGILYLPYMTFNGLKARVALAESVNRMGARVGGRVFVSVLLIVLLNYLVGTLVSLAGSVIASIIVETLSYAFTLVYLVSLSFISYYEINELPREDYPREFFFTKIKRR